MVTSILRKIACFGLMMLLGIHFTNAQKYYFDTYGVKEGLSQSKVYKVFQDRGGFIWVGTASGASRFDGLNFKNFTADDGMAENGVRTITQDSKGNIVFGHTGGGVSIYNGNTMRNVIPDSLELESDITCIIEDSKGRLWIATMGSGAYVITNYENIPDEEPVLKHFTGKTKLSDRVFSIYQTKDESIYFIIDGMIKYYDEENDSFEVYKHEGLSYYFQITSMFEDNEQNRWYGTHNGGLLRQDGETGNVSVFDTQSGMAHNFVSTINQAPNGDIWVGTWGGGITRIDPNFRTFNLSSGLPDEEIFSITPDREGNMLIGTNNHGLVIFKGEYIVSFQKEDGLNGPQVSAIVEDSKNNILIGTNLGINKYNMLGNTLRYSKAFDKLKNTEIIGLKSTSKGEIWIATKDEGIYSYNPEKQQLHYPMSFNSRVLRYGKVVNNFEIDDDDHIYVGTLDGLYYLEPEKNAHARILPGDISALYKDNSAAMWVGIRGKGLTRIVDTVFEKISALPKITPLCITQDLEGNTWIGTEGQGVTKLKPDMQYTRYKTSDGLLADYISALLTDKEGNVWIGTNKGLNKYDSDESKFIAYTTRSGFSGIEVRKGALYSDKMGNVWCGTVKGLFKFNVGAERINRLEPLTHITNLKVNLKDRPLIEGAKFTHREKNIFFEFHSICLTDAEKVKYQYMLEGADVDWQPITTQTIKNYSPLPPGRYKFMVKACNNRGVWNAEAQTYSFTIQPPFYFRWWFILTVFLIILAGIIVYINIREANLRKEKIVLEEKVKVRTAEVVSKNNELARKNKDIMDSINYAQRIQQALLPTQEEIKTMLPNSFVLFKPKDIVSGDFYWIEQLDDCVMFSAIDCTGHGVPGAFMSILGHDGLMRAIGEFNLRKPHDILEQLNTMVQDSLKSNEDFVVKDGMDMALCVYYKDTQTLEFSGANNPIYIIRSSRDEHVEKDGELLEPKMENYGYRLYEIKGNKQPIGAYINRVPFVNHSIKVKSQDAIYIFSDGYADQFGGPKGRKFMYRNLKEMLLKNQQTTMEQQKTFYNQIINAWKSGKEQIDDIILMGVKID